MILNGLESRDHLMPYCCAIWVAALKIGCVMPPDVLPIGLSNKLERSNAHP